MSDGENSTASPKLSQELLGELLRLDHEVAQGRTPANSSQRPEAALAQRALEALEDAFPRIRPFGLKGSGARRETIGRYQIGEVLGAGGFAIVYRGMDQQSGQSVAVKIPRPQTLLSAEHRERFLIEADTARRLNHRSIVSVLDAGEDNGLPYIVYEYCKGPTLAAWLLSHPGQISATQSARIVLKLSEAMAYSHQQGVIHRDIKPSNVLLFADPSEADPLFPFHPRLTDFGLARLADVPSRQTRSSAMLGTPAYMAPELVATDARSPPGHAVDLYSLGAVLYELLTGRPPFVAKSPWQVLMMVRDKEPAAPRIVQPLVPRDIETICLKCLSKLPRDRYATAEQLSQDLQRFLAGERIAARRPTRRQLVTRWSRRHPLSAILAAGLAMSLLSLLVGFAIAFQNRASLLDQIHVQNQALVRNVERLNAAVQSERSALVEASRHATVANQFRYASDVALAASCLERHDIRDARRILDATLDDPSLQTIREFTVRYLDARTQAQGRILSADRQVCWVLKCSPDQRRLLAGGDRSLVQVFDTETGRVLHELDAEQIEINGVAFSPDGKSFATAGDDGTVRLWDLHTLSPIRTYAALVGVQAYAVEFTEDGRTLVVGGNSPMLVFLDIKSGNRQELKIESAETIETMANSPDRKRLALGLRPRGVALLNIQNRSIDAHLTMGGERTHAVAFSDDGQWLAASSEDEYIKLWDTTSLTEAAVSERPDAVSTLAFQGQRLLCGDRGGVISIWDLAIASDGVTSSFDLIDQRLAHSSAVQSLAPGGPETYYSGSRDTLIKVWNARYDDYTVVSRMPEAAEPHVYSRFLLARSDSPSGFWRINGTNLELCDAAKDEVIATRSCTTAISSIAKFEHGVIIGDEVGRLALLNEQLGSIRQMPRAFEDAWVDSVCFAQDTQRLFVINHGGGLVVLDYETGRRLASEPNFRTGCLSSDGNLLAVLPRDSNDVVVLDTRTLGEVARLKGHQGTICALEFSLDGAWLVSAGQDRQAIVWDTNAWSPVNVFGGHDSAIICVAMTDDCRTIALATESGTVKLWHAPTGRALLQLASDLTRPASLLFTADGNYLVALLATGAIRTYRATPVMPPNSLQDDR